ncbi:hypothetical protein PQR64_23235 [Paraburkholderia phytofirmans]|uniref:hypothetical protein n=1 Tax=Paraburkholderia phytofirmans TaxID=261302 RepID=UPI0038BAB448
MVTTSIGQMNNETAKGIYRAATRHVDLMVNAGKIAPANAENAWAQLVVKEMMKRGLSVPKDIAARAGVDAAAGAPAAALSAPAVATNTAKVAATATARDSARSVLRAGAPVALALFLLEGAHTGYRLFKGDIDLAEAGRRTAESAGSNAGGLGGAMLGAAAGTAILPFLGAAAGGLLLGAAGSVAGRKLVRIFTR